MASAAIWLEELGIPPREVCLDWAWQIKTQIANIAYSADDDITPLHWERIEVSDTGELVLPSDLHKYSPDERLQELLSWAQSEEPCPNGSSFSPTDRTEFESELRALTDICVSRFAEHSGRSLTSSRSDASQITIPQAVVGSQRNRSRTRTAGKSSSANQLIVALKQHWMVASFASVILIVGCYFAFNAGTRKAKSTKPVELTVEAAPSTSPGTELRSDNTSISIGQELNHSVSLAPVTEMPQLGALEPEVLDISRVTMPSVASSDLSGRDSKKLESLESVGAGSPNTTTEATQNNSGPVEATSATQTGASPELTERDVMQELETLTKAAAKNVVESDMAVPDTELTKPAPLILPTNPMVQVQKFAAKIKVRPRQPVWQILLSVDDEFELTPNEPQDITDRQITTWILSNSDSKSPRVRLVIQAQAAPGRQTALRWRIFASAEDLPDLMLPLDKEMLQPLQERLRIYSPMAQREAERLKQLASVAERDVRVALSKQRANLESQSKLASRLSTIVAEAQLLDDLLRSQLTLYAKLRDGDGPDAPTLLQFGDLSELEKNVSSTEAK